MSDNDFQDNVERDGDRGEAFCECGAVARVFHPGGMMQCHDCADSDAPPPDSPAPAQMLGEVWGRRFGAGLRKAITDFAQKPEPVVPVTFTGIVIDEQGDPVAHPSHYTSSKAVCSDCGHPIECIDITQHMGYSLGNVTKYVWRCDLKHDAIEDLRKARQYLDFEIAKRERAQLETSKIGA